MSFSRPDGAPRVLLVTGGCGFIGSHFVRQWLGEFPADQVVVYDALTYAGNRENLADLKTNPHLVVVVGNIENRQEVRATCLAYRVTTIVNFAAQTHVDQSIAAPFTFSATNLLGTHVLLEVSRELGLRFHQVSTDEVYGNVPVGERRREEDKLAPRSPYAASKAAADHMVLAYHTTYNLAVTLTRGSNTVGPRQHLEKVLPLFITNALLGLPLPVYGDGLQQRDYMHVFDHCRAIMVVVLRGHHGEVYNTGTGQEISNLMLAHEVLNELGADPGLIRHVQDRPGHDRRYAVETRKLRALGWACAMTSAQAVQDTTRWYAANESWWRPVREGSFSAYYEQQYSARLGGGDP